MTLFGIELAEVTSVLIVDTWYLVRPGSFQFDSDGFWFKTELGREIAGPGRAVLAVSRASAP